MKKKCLTLILALVMCLGLLPTAAFAADSDFRIDKSGELCEYTGPGGDVVIPDGVTSIGHRTGVVGAFSGLTNVTSVTIPDSVTSIAYGAFHSCTGLTSITIPSSVTKIDAYAFYGCTGLTSVTITGGGDDVLWINPHAFEGCTSLTSVTIGSGVTTIHMYTFYGCTSLAEVTIPVSVTSIREDAFTKTNLTDVYYGGSETQWKAVSKGLYTGIISDKVRYNSAGPCAIHSYSVTTTPATCVAEGVETHTCTVCGKVVKETLAKTDHTPGDAVGNGRGAHSTKCAVCGKVISTDDCTYDEGKVTRQPTVTSKGEMTYTCTVCGETKTEAIPKLEDTSCEEHAFDKGVVTRQPTTATEGEMTYTCTVCGETKTEAIPRLEDEPCKEHIYDEGRVTRQPTITAEGEMTYTCTVCGETKIEAVPRLDDPRKKFADMEPNAFYLEPVAWAVDKKVTTGKTTTTFAPKENCTHGQILTFLWRAAGEPASSVTLPFETTGKEYYLGAAKWAYEKGMIGADFKHGTPCTRADAVNYIWQAAGKGAASYDGRFTDVPASFPYATAVAWAVENGVTTGATATTFNPNGICNRGQIVTFLYRYFGK